MKNKKAKILALILVITSSLGLFSQSITLNIRSINKNENLILTEINFKKKHRNTLSIQKELSKINKELKLNGYFLSTIDSVKIVKNDYLTYYSLNNKIDSIILNSKNLPKKTLTKFNFKKNELRMPIQDLNNLLSKILDSFEENGNSFAKIKLINYRIQKNNLFSEIEFTNSDKRKINKLIIKGYEKFPKSFIKNLFNINNRTLFNKETLNEISKRSRSLDFVSEIKPPETLFTKDSTKVYLYLRKKKGSSFDGLINFSSQENEKLEFNGYLDLKLKNILNTGESINLLWNSLNNERQQFSITTNIPYIFNTKVSSYLDFSIYKQDSTFLNTKINSKLSYQIKHNSNLFLSINSETSEKLIETNSNNIETFKNTFIGFGYQYRKPKNDNFRNDLFYISINPSFGKRNSKVNSYNQIKIESTITYLLDLNKKNSFYLKNKTGLLNSENYIDNELFRIGGNNTIRGFNEQSIFVENYITQNIEYRYHTSTKSYMYTVTDLALIKSKNNNESLIGLGLGYLFNTNNSQINLSTTIGTNTKTALKIKNTQFFINWVNFF